MGEVIMYNVSELKDRLIIIKSSELDDATILDENYRQLIKNTAYTAEQEQYKMLHSLVQRRIEMLLGKLIQDNNK
jgi:hypothetical protein